MFDDNGLRMMRMAQAGYCCSQILLLLGLEDMNRENPDLVRAMAGLCKGLGRCSGPCGVLSGGAALIGLLTGKGADTDAHHDKMPLLLDEFGQWFEEHACGQHGGITCADIVGDTCEPDQEVCGKLIHDAYDRIQDLFAEHGIDPSLGKEPAHG